MSTDVEVIPTPQMVELPDLSTLTLDELADLATREYEACESHLSVALQHAINVGGVLDHVAEREKASGNYTRWCEQNLPFSPMTACIYRRVFVYRHEIIESGAKSLYGAQKVLRDLPELSKRWYGDDLRQRAKEMAEAGMLATHIAAELGVSRRTIRNWNDPVSRKAENARRRAAQAALREQEKRKERDRLARDAGGEASKAYSAIRQALTALDRAISAADTPGQRDALTNALRAAHKAEDEIVEALKASRSAQ